MLLVSGDARHRPKGRCTGAFSLAAMPMCALKSKNIYPRLLFYKGVPYMINSNENLKKKRGNGSQCRVGIKLKDDAVVVWKNWEGRRVKSICVEDVEYMTCELLNQSKTKTYFQLKPETDQVTIRHMHVEGTKIGSTYLLARSANFWNWGIQTHLRIHLANTSFLFFVQRNANSVDRDATATQFSSVVNFLWRNSVVGWKVLLQWLTQKIL